MSKPYYKIADKQKITRDATLEVQLRRCVAYCLYNKYNLETLEEFDVNISKDWSFQKDKMFVYNSPLACIHAYSDTVSPITKSSPQGKPLDDPETFLKSVKNTEYVRCRDLFELTLKHSGYTVKNVMMKTGLTVDQEAGTCWLAACFNLLLNIPEAKTIFWNKFNIKKPMKHNVLFNLFIDTEVGNRILNRYAHKYTQKYKTKYLKNNMKSILEKTAPLQGGLPKLMMESFKEELKLKDLKSRTTMKSYYAVQNSMELLRLSCTLSDNAKTTENRVKKLLQSLLKAFEKKSVLRGAILVSFKKNESTGHAITICRTHYGDDDDIRVFNWGQSGSIYGNGEKMLLDFFSIYPRNPKLVMYEYENNATRTLFTSPPTKKYSPKKSPPTKKYSPKKSPPTKKYSPKKCQGNMVYDKEIKECRERKILKARPKCTAQKVYDRQSQTCKARQRVHKKSPKKNLQSHQRKH